MLISICLNYEHFLFLLSTVLFLPASFFFFFFFGGGKNRLYLEVATWIWLRQSSFYLHPKYHSQGSVKCTSSSFHQTRSPCALVTGFLHCSFGLEAHGEQPRGPRELDKGTVVKLVPTGRDLPGCHQSWGTGLIGGRRHSDVLAPVDTAFLAFPAFWPDCGLARGRKPFFAFTVIFVKILSLSLIAV